MLPWFESVRECMNVDARGRFVLTVRSRAYTFLNNRIEWRIWCEKKTPNRGYRIESNVSLELCQLYQCVYICIFRKEYVVNISNEIRMYFAKYNKYNSYGMHVYVQCTWFDIQHTHCIIIRIHLRVAIGGDLGSHLTEY